MTTSISFRPQINISPNFAQKSEANQFKVALEQIKTDYQNNQTTDIGFMTQKTNLESKIQETKTEPIKLVEDIKPSESTEKTSEAKVLATDPAFDKTVKNLQNGKQYSLNERDKILTNQMNQFAINNRILHGLF